MLVNTLSFMCSDPTAVITVWLLTDTTKAVPSTSTRESREPLPAARCTLGKAPERLRVEVDAAALDARERVLGEVQLLAAGRVRERVGERAGRCGAGVAPGAPAPSS